MTTAAQKLTKARANLVMLHPFFGSLALRMKLVEEPGIKTADCDGVTIRYNPKFIDGLSQSKVQGLLAHEVMHPGFLHHTRRGNREPRKWNVACDYAINGILTKANFDLPEKGCINPAYDGMTSEHIYSILPDQSEEDGDDPGGDGGVRDSPNAINNGGSQSQQNNEEATWKMAVAQAAHIAKQAGKLPAELERLIGDLLEPILPWRSILRRFATEKRADDFSWSRGNRRFLGQGLYLPSRMSDDAMGTVVVVIDTSGSIGENELNEFASEIKGIVAETRPAKTIVMYCDAMIAHIDEFAPDDDLVFECHGGGGTDFRPPFEHIEEHCIDPKALIYLTDGYGPFPNEPPAYPTLWCINNDQIIPPFGEHLVLEV